MSHILEFSHGSSLLNEEQFSVVTSPTYENQRILASAGSGKTTTITARIAYLVEHYDIDASEILLVTFSREAAQEMIHRLYNLIGQVNIYAGTFHALSLQILRDNCPSMLRDQPFIDELPYRLVKWLETDSAKKWVERFKTIIVDEFQDINDIQWQLIKGFLHPRATISIVGDDAQNIYTWRGSSVDFILNFHTFVKNVKDYQLCVNYRSTDAIVTIANSIMRFIPTLPFKEKMVANQRGGTKPEVHYFFRASDEYDWIANSLQKLVKQYKTTPLKFAVISRYNHDLFKIEERLHSRGIPYNLCTSYDPEQLHNADQLLRKTTKITLTTIHASKGLEWDAVFLMNLNDDVFPSRKSDEEIVCERRLFYVAITRAKKALYMTYSRNESALSRFVREIPRLFLKFHNVTSFKLSTNEFSQSSFSIDDMLRGFDGADWNHLRQTDSVPNINDIITTSLYKFGQIFSMPEWVRQYDVRETWLEMLRWVVTRECAIHQNKVYELFTPEVTDALLTLRIYKEDIDFWELYEAELEHLVHKFLKHTPQMPPVEYHQLDEYVKTKLRHLNWSIQDTSHALVIIAKIRGQLRPMRHHGFNLDEFKFGVVCNSVPTEMRPEVLQSWKNVINKSYKTYEILGDIWRVASLKSVVDGRNIPLYKYNTILPHLVQLEHQLFIQAIESSIPLWIIEQDSPTLNFMFQLDELQPIHFDVMTQKCTYVIFFDPLFVPSIEDKILLLLKQYSYNKINNNSLEYIGFINIASGAIIQYKISSTIQAQLNRLWSHLQKKYHLH